MNLNIESYLDWIKNWTLQTKDVVKKYFQKAQSENNKYNAYINFHSEEKIFEDLANIDTENSKLKWAIIAIKDNILLEWTQNTCASKMLDWFTAPYTATCIKNLQKNGWIIIGKTNMDEFAMWGSNENSWRKPAINKYWNNRISWGSSWGSAVAVDADLCIWALWTDTWWSVRQPSALCNVVWMKPTYWMVSRYWVQSMASSLDQVWVITKTVDDSKLLLECIKWYDEKDSQSNKKADEEIKAQKKNISDYKIAIPNQFMWKWLDPDIKKLFENKIEKLKSHWIQVDFFDLPILDHLISIYYILMPAESSTNLARFDWIRFGLQWSTHDFDSIMDYITDIRTKWFWEEVKRRILIWSFVLSSEHYEWFYLKAQKARTILKQEFDKLFQKYDFIASPTSPVFAREVWDENMDPLATYLADIYTVLANLLWNPAISIPMWITQKDWEEFSSGFQLIWDKWNEWDLFQLAKFIEKK